MWSRISSVVATTLSVALWNAGLVVHGTLEYARIDPGLKNQGGRTKCCQQAKAFSVELKVLDKIGELASTRGNPGAARKAALWCRPGSDRPGTRMAGEGDPADHQAARRACVGSRSEPHTDDRPTEAIGTILNCGTL
jgi:hypothetical protein